MSYPRFFKVPSLSNLLNQYLYDDSNKTAEFDRKVKILGLSTAVISIAFRSVAFAIELTEMLGNAWFGIGLSVAITGACIYVALLLVDSLLNSGVDEKSSLLLQH